MLTDAIWLTKDSKVYLVAYPESLEFEWNNETKEFTLNCTNMILTKSFSLNITNFKNPTSTKPLNSSWKIKISQQNT